MSKFTPRAMWTPAQMGHVSDYTMPMVKQPSYRMRRWWIAYSTALVMHDLPFGTVTVPCAWCEDHVHAWLADVDHAVSRFNGGDTVPGNLCLMHAHCNRVVKGTRNLNPRRLAALKEASKRVHAVVQSPAFVAFFRLHARQVTRPGNRALWEDKRNG